MATFNDFKNEYYNEVELSESYYDFYRMNAHIRRKFSDHSIAYFVSYKTPICMIDIANSIVYVCNDFDCFSTSTTRQVVRLLSKLFIDIHSVNDVRFLRKTYEDDNLNGIRFISRKKLVESF